MPSRVSLLFVLLLAGRIPAAAQPTVWFEDRARDAGLTVVTRSGGADKAHILESTGNGVLVLDYDGDGWPDLYFVAAYRLPRTAETEDDGSRLYRNLGRSSEPIFEDVTERAGAGLHVYGHGGCVGDVDGDGDADLYVTAFGPNVLLENLGGRFEDATAATGVGDPGWSIGCALFDADGDGDLDLFVANYVEATWDEVLAARRTRRWRDQVAVMDGPRGLPEAANTFYRNRGDGTFEEATEVSGLAGRDYSMAAVAFDADHDGDLDLFVANDSTPNRFYRNRGGGVFDEAGTASGLAYDGDGGVQGSMGVGVGDADGDGWLDLVVTNFAHDHYIFYRSLGGTLFQDDSFASGLAAATYVPLGWAPILFDVDLDGDLDLFLANGHIYPQVDDAAALNERYRQRDQLLVADGGRWHELAEAGPGLEVVESSRGAAALDVDLDGDVDLAVSHQDAAPSLLVNATTGAGHGLTLVPGSAPGTRVTVTAAGRVQVGQVVAGGSYASESERALVFGLGSVTSAERVEIVWPDGRRQAWIGLPTGRYVVPAPGTAGR
jgi:enediyne biosynthesis protein E4